VTFDYDEIDSIAHSKRKKNDEIEGIKQDPSVALTIKMHIYTLNKKIFGKKEKRKKEKRERKRGGQGKVDTCEKERQKLPF